MKAAMTMVKSGASAVGCTPSCVAAEALASDELFGTLAASGA